MLKKSNKQNATWSNAMDVVGVVTINTTRKLALLILHELLETVTSQSFVFLVVNLMFLYTAHRRLYVHARNGGKMQNTNSLRLLPPRYVTLRYDQH